ncbi:MAG: glycosyltransferase, partial [Candidatus Omnitrophica bacterium]|nr:glycosyltransferase [Candidatus Omnitrophota bacterium]
GLYIASRVIFGILFYTVPAAKNYYPTISIVIPAYNEGKTIRETIVNALSSGYPMDKLEVITINDGSKDNTLEVMREMAKEFSSVRIINFEQNRGKREGMAAGIKEAKGEFVVFVDSDSYLTKGSLYQIIQPFTDRNISAVSGHTDVENRDVNGLTRMQGVWYYIMFRIFKAGESVFSTVSCCPGCFSAYRRTTLLRVLDDFTGQTLFGVKCTFGDDRSLTNMILGKGGRVIYHSGAIATTIVPENIKQYLRQQLRWKRSWGRESLTVASHFMWKRNPVMGVTYYISLFVALFSPVAIFFHLIWDPYFNGISVWPYILGVNLIPLLLSLYYLKQTHKWDFVFGLAYMYLYIFFLGPLNYYAFLTMDNNVWGTRSVKEASSRSSLSLKGIVANAFQAINNASASVAANIASQKKQVPLFDRGVNFTIGLIQMLLILLPLSIAAEFLLGFSVTYAAAEVVTAVEYHTFFQGGILFAIPAAFTALQGFLYNYWIGIAGMAVVGILFSLLWLGLTRSHYTGMSIVALIDEMYPDLSFSSRKKLVGRTAREINKIVERDQYAALSPIGLLSRVPVTGAVIKFMKAHTGTRPLMHGIEAVLEIVSMLFLYRFFLRHLLVPFGLAVNAYSVGIPEQDIRTMIRASFADLEKEESRLAAVKVVLAGKSLVTLQFITNYLDTRIALISDSIRRENSISRIGYALALPAFLFTKATISLITQRVMIAIASRYVAHYILTMFFNPVLMNTPLYAAYHQWTGLFIITPYLILSSFIVVFFLDMPVIWNLSKDTMRKYNNDEISFNQMVLVIGGAAMRMFIRDTISMVLIGPEIHFALVLTGGVPVLGETVRFMEEFVYGANGKEGIGVEILKALEGTFGEGSVATQSRTDKEQGTAEKSDMIPGWTVPASGWKIDRQNHGMYPSPENSMRITTQGEAHTDLVTINAADSFVFRYMVDAVSLQSGAVNLYIDEYTVAGEKVTLVNRVMYAGQSEEGITYQVKQYTPTSKNINAVGISIKAESASGDLTAYVDGVRLSRIDPGTADALIRRPHVIFRFDDGWSSQMKAEEILRSYGYHGVFNLIPETMWDERTRINHKADYMNIQDIRTIREAGNQVGTHSAAYDITASSPKTQFQETFGNANILRTFGLDSLSYASPKCLYDQNTLRFIYRYFDSHQIERNYDIKNYEFPINPYRIYTVEPRTIGKDTDFQGDAVE